MSLPVASLYIVHSSQFVLLDTSFVVHRTLFMFMFSEFKVVKVCLCVSTPTSTHKHTHTDFLSSSHFFPWLVRLKTRRREFHLKCARKDSDHVPSATVSLPLPLSLTVSLCMLYTDTYLSNSAIICTLYTLLSPCTCTTDIYSYILYV